MGEKTGSDRMVEAFLECGVDVMFANPGTTEMSVVQSLDTVPGMRAVLGLHENVVTGAADGYGRMTGKPSATLLHLGVGLANGVANLHNARRAGTPIVNVVGEMATWHRETDPLLGMDIEGIAGSVSCLVRTPDRADDVADDTIRCIAATRRVSAGASRVTTLVVPHDSAREVARKARLPPPEIPAEDCAAFEQTLQVDEATRGPLRRRAVDEALEALKTSPACLFVGGKGLWAGVIEDAGRVAVATGATLMCENAFPRVDRGGGLPPVTRLAYFPNDAKKELGKFKAIVFVGARVPVAMFGYEDMISHVVDPSTQKIVTLDTHNVPGALQFMAKELGVATGPTRPPSDKSPVRPKPPKGKLTAPKLCTAIAAEQPENAILIDESLTSGGTYWKESQGCPLFSHLTLTGGAIGQGPPLAVGAAIACPKRRVINFQADGSGMYTIQALWTQAREKLDITTVVCANRTYNILKIEQNKQKLSQKGSAAQSLTDLSNPAMSFVKVAEGLGVPAVSVTTCEEFLEHFTRSIATPGPFLIEAILQ